jgi:hypothetical protein
MVVKTNEWRLAADLRFTRMGADSSLFSTGTFYDFVILKLQFVGESPRTGAEGSAPLLY